MSNIFHQLCNLYDLKPFCLYFQNPPPLFNEVSATIIEAEKVTCLRDELQIKHEEDYKTALDTIKSQLQLIEGADIKENLRDQIRHWIIECR